MRSAPRPPRRPRNSIERGIYTETDAQGRTRYGLSYTANLSRGPRRLRREMLPACVTTVEQARAILELRKKRTVFARRDPKRPYTAAERDRALFRTGARKCHHCDGDALPSMSMCLRHKLHSLQYLHATYMGKQPRVRVRGTKWGRYLSALKDGLLDVPFSLWGAR